MSNSPRFIVYVAPRPISCMNQHYSPPEEDCAFIRLLWKNGLNPSVNSQCQPSKQDLASCSGFVVVEGRIDSIMKIGEYKEGRIKCLQYFCNPLMADELDAIKPLWAWFYGLSHFKKVSEEYQYLVDLGCCTGTECMISEEEFDQTQFIIE